MVQGVSFCIKGLEQAKELDWIENNYLMTYSVIY